MPLDEEPQRVTNDAVRARVVAGYLTERWKGNRYFGSACSVDERIIAESPIEHRFVTISRPVFTNTSLSSGRVTPIPLSCLKASEGLGTRKRSRLYNQVIVSGLPTNHEGISAHDVSSRASCR